MSAIDGVRRPGLHEAVEPVAERRRPDERIHLARSRPARSCPRSRCRAAFPPGCRARVRTTRRRCRPAAPACDARRANETSGSSRARESAPLRSGVVGRRPDRQHLEPAGVVVVREQVGEPRGGRRRVERPEHAEHDEPVDARACPRAAAHGPAGRRLRRPRDRSSTACLRARRARRRSPPERARQGRSRAGRCRRQARPCRARSRSTRPVRRFPSGGRRSRRSGRAACAPSRAATTRRRGAQARGTPAGPEDPCAAGTGAFGGVPPVGAVRSAIHAARGELPIAFTRFTQAARSASVAAGSAVPPRQTCTQNARPASTSESLNSGS